MRTVLASFLLLLTFAFAALWTASSDITDEVVFNPLGRATRQDAIPRPEYGLASNPDARSHYELAVVRSHLRWTHTVRPDASSTMSDDRSAAATTDWNRFGFRYQRATVGFRNPSTDMPIPGRTASVTSYSVELLWPTLVLALIPLCIIWRMIRHHALEEDRLPGLCPTCGYDLRFTPNRCPECGSVPSQAND